MTIRSGEGGEVEVMGVKMKVGKWTVQPMSDYLATEEKMRDNILQGQAVPKELLDCHNFSGTYASHMAEMDAHIKAMAKAMLPLADGLTWIAKYVVSLGNWKWLRGQLRLASVKKRCPWHCKKHERRKSGRRPLTRD